jgi:ActR/RegA family two-component response regulator
MVTDPNRLVLVVEDSWLLATELESWLREEGLAVAGPAGSVAEAMRIADLERPQFALVDFNLGGEMSGGLIEYLKEFDISVVIVTGYSDHGGIDDEATVLQKPCSKALIMQALETAGLQRRAAH